MNEIHIFKNTDEGGGSYEVWLDTELDARDGVCIGQGVTKESAIDAALADLQQASNVLRMNKVREAQAMADKAKATTNNA